MRYGAFSFADAKVLPFFKLANFFALFFQKSFQPIQQSAHKQLYNSDLNNKSFFLYSSMKSHADPLSPHII